MGRNQGQGRGRGRDPEEGDDLPADPEELAAAASREGSGTTDEDFGHTPGGDTQGSKSDDELSDAGIDPKNPQRRIDDAKTKAAKRIELATQGVRAALQERTKAYEEAWPHLSPEERQRRWIEWCTAESIANPTAINYKGRGIDLDKIPDDFRGEEHPSRDPLAKLLIQ